VFGKINRVKTLPREADASQAAWVSAGVVTDCCVLTTLFNSTHSSRNTAVFVHFVNY
jgi:hypothetical protein